MYSVIQICMHYVYSYFTCFCQLCLCVCVCVNVKHRAFVMACVCIYVYVCVLVCCACVYVDATSGLSMGWFACVCAYTVCLCAYVLVCLCACVCCVYSFFSYALRVFPAVTRLTVYRRLRVWASIEVSTSWWKFSKCIKDDVPLLKQVPLRFSWRIYSLNFVAGSYL